MGCYAKITRQWEDGDQIVVFEVGADEQHPDLLDEICTRVLALDRDAAVDEAAEVRLLRDGIRGQHPGEGLREEA